MKKKILIIDDDLELCEVLAESFTDEGYAVCHRQNGIQGKREISENSYDYLILDIKIPGLSGFDILAWLKQTQKKIKIIVLTGMPLKEEISQLVNGRDSQKEKLLQYANAVFNKPFATDELLAALKKLQ